MADPLTIISAISAGAGLLGKLFGRSPEDERQARRAELRRQINEIRTRTLAEHAKTVQAGVRRLNETTLAQAATSRQAARRRATALGLTGEAESFILPAEGNVLEQGSRARQGYETEAAEIGANLRRSFDQAELGTEASFADRPIEPGLSDYLLTIGEAGLGYAQGQRQAELQQEYIDLLKPQTATSTVAPKPIAQLNPGVVPAITSDTDFNGVISAANNPLLKAMQEFQQETRSRFDRQGINRRRARLTPSVAY